MKTNTIKKALVVFVRTPELGRVKTRLQADLGRSKTLKLYKSFITKIVNRVVRLRSVDKFLGCYPTKNDNFLVELTENNKFKSFNQQGSDLGEKIVNGFRKCFKEGYDKVVIIGSDSPTIPADYIKQAFRELEDNDFVLGPGCDGGYYLVGANKVFKEVFKGIPWDSSGVLNKTLDKLDSLGIKFSLLPFWYDVDTIEDLRFYKRHLRYLGKIRNNSPVGSTGRKG